MLQARLRCLSQARPSFLPFLASRRHASSIAPRAHPKWGVFSDIHFQQEDLSRIVETSQWITDVFCDAQVTQIFCLGDVINTREHVNVQALSATAKFFDELRRIAPVHIVLGNHDMNLKHSSRVSSLDVFDTEGFKGSCKLYKDFADVEVEGVKCLMVPWVENHTLMVDRLGEMPCEEKNQRILFGHLAVSGAIQQPSVPVESRYRTHTGVLKGRHLVDFRGTFLGHFHHHQAVVDGKVWYVGSPMQHHFGDKADDRRGVLFLQPTITSQNEAPAMEFIQNPKWDLFREVSLQDLRASAGDDKLHLPFDVVGKRINLRCKAVDAPEFETWRAKLVETGAGDVRRKVEIGRGIFSGAADAKSNQNNTELEGKVKIEETANQQPEQQPEEIFRAPTTATFIEALPLFLNTIPTDSNMIPENQQADYIATAERLMKIADANYTDGVTSATSTNSSLSVFQGTLRNLTIQNFFSIQGTLSLPFFKLNPGTWFLTGPNGSGKSTVLEAIVWCLFGEVLRSDMGVADLVNDVVGKNCCVRIDFENGYSIERFRKFTSKGTGPGPGLKLYKNGQEVPDFERGETRKTQIALERDILGCDFATFTKSVIFGDQGGGAGNFLTLDTKQRREVLEELLGISNFEGYLKAVREEKRVVEKEYLTLKSQSETIAIELKRLETERCRVQDTVGPKERMRDDAELKLRELEKEVAKFEEDRVRMEKEQGELLRWNKLYDTLQRAQESKRIITDQLRLREDKLQEYQKVLLKIEEFRPLHARWVASQKDLDRGQKTLQMKTLEYKNVADRVKEKDLETHKNQLAIRKGVCPTCRQSLDNPTRVEEHLEQMKRKKEALEKKAAGLAAELATLKSEVQGHEERQAAVILGMMERQLTPGYLNTLPECERETRNMLLTTQMPMKRLEMQRATAEQEVKVLLAGKTMDEVARLAHRSADQDVSTLQRVMSTHEGLLKRIQELSSRKTALTSSLTRLTTEVKYATSHLKNMESQLAIYCNELSSGANRITEIERALRILVFWEVAFNKKQATTSAPNIRHYLISNSINELNTLIQSNMEILTNPTTIGSGNGSSKAYSLPISFTPDLSIYPPSSFGKRSSGQRKRNNLAVLFALFQLIRQKSRFRADFIMLDEVFDALDKEGQMQAAELISAVSTQGTDRSTGGEVKHVLVVTHSEALEDIVRVGDGGAGARVIRVQMGERGTEMQDPEGVIEHIQGITTGKEGIPEILPPTVKKRKGRPRKVKNVEAEVEAETNETEVSMTGN
ncbi:P-loop containing nucleoside triphosphate hydrolase protein [Terfezia boudieri ATCC MYA-4762]|uniref:P-loop containing nucleoside triphosphate hydrolase protein n=1 Tax=Terfezia boudieri ATCC MYA-4762 TaxID=1051890 RepID=A0A3N4LJJ7_9PEZI|nr:P-loop containing nucleoside triphosphate hydrolase protein [Terfezia boudieri ATCC MYA-4762]